MTIYLINIFFIFVFATLFLQNKVKNGKMIFCVIMTIQLVLISGLRDISIGTDTYAYKAYDFDVIKTKSRDALLTNFINVLFKGVDGKDPGFPLFEKFVQLFTSDYQIYLMIIALIFLVPLGIWIYRNSAEPAISFLLYSCLFYSFFSITGIRQTIATALVVLIGYKYIKEKKLIPFLLLTFIAFTIHKSSVFFLPFYFIAHKKITKTYIIIVTVATPIVFIFKNEIMRILANVSGYGIYANQFEGAGTWTFTIFLFMLAAAALLRGKIMIHNNAQSVHYINALILSVLFVPFTFVDPSAMRIVQYFTIFLMLLVPEIIHTFTGKDRIIVYSVSAAALVVLFIQTNPQYIFFWQG